MLVHTTCSSTECFAPAKCFAPAEIALPECFAPTYLPPMTTLFHNHTSLGGRPKLDLLAPLRHWIDNIEIRNSSLAHLLCRLIPCTCPFERNLHVFGHTFHIPPLCKLNPLYNEVVYLRLRALSYLSDDCGIDVTQYIC